MADPKISAVVPVFNGEAFIAQAIRSILDQTYRDVECIVVDDGSTDATPDVLRSFGNDITVIRQDNAGVAAARNAGLAAARGEAIAFLDADDLWLPTKIERQVDVWRGRNDLSLVYCGYAVADASLRRRYDILPTEWSQRLLGALRLEGYGIGFSFTALVPKAALDATGGFSEWVSTAADLDCAFRLSRIGSVVGIADVLALYRMHSLGQMHRGLGPMESDNTRIIAEALDSEADRRRATANLHMHLAAGKLRERRFREVLRHLRRVAANGPRRALLLPIGSLRRRAVRRLFGRWPRRSRPSDSVVA